LSSPCLIFRGQGVYNSRGYSEREQFAIPEADVVRVITEELKGNTNMTRHLMTDLGWKKKKVKWDGKEYARSIWVKPEFHVNNGKIQGPEGYAQDLAKHFERPDDLYAFLSRSIVQELPEETYNNEAAGRLY
jgi:hypothetical protein